MSNLDRQYNPNDNSNFWIDRKFKLYFGVESDGDTYWFSKGVYVTTNASVDLGGKLVSIEGSDKFTILTSNENAHRFSGTIKIEAGQPFDEAICALLALDIGNGKPLDPIKPVIDTTLNTITVPYDIIKNSDTSVGDMLVEFAEIMDADIWYDDDGRLYVSKSVVDDCVNRYEQFSSQWDFTEEDSYMYEPSLTCDQSKVVNTVIVTNDTADGELDYYWAENDNPQSPLRVSLIGTKASDIVTTSMGYNEQRRKEYANRLLQEQCLNAYSVDFTSSALPHLDVNRTITITYSDYDFDKETFIVQSLDFTLGDGEMSVSATQTIWLPSYGDSGAANFYTNEIEPDQYTITFDVMSAKGKAPATKHKREGEVITLPTSQGFYEADGYKFEGWLDNVYGKLHKPNSTYYVPDQNVTFFAQWTGDKVTPNYWTFQFLITNSNRTITLPILASSGVGYVNWGDGSANQDYSFTQSHSHTYAYDPSLEQNIATIRIYVLNTDGNYDNFSGLFSRSDNNGSCEQLYSLRFPINMRKMPSNILGSNTYVYSNLQEIVLSPVLENINNSFRNCPKLKHIVIPETVTSINNSFFFSGLEDINIPSKVSVCTIMNCNDLTKAVYNGVGDLSAPTFYNCPNLKEVIVGGGVTSITGGWASSIGSGSSSELKITLSEGLKQIINAGLSNPRIRSINIPDSVVFIGQACLSESKITEITVPYTCFIDPISVPSGCEIKFKSLPAVKYDISAIASEQTIELVSEDGNNTYNGKPKVLNYTVVSGANASVKIPAKSPTPWATAVQPYLTSYYNNGLLLWKNIDFACGDIIISPKDVGVYYGGRIFGINRCTGALTDFKYEIKPVSFSSGTHMYFAKDEYDFIDDYAVVKGDFPYKGSEYLPQLSLSYLLDGDDEPTVLQQGKDYNVEYSRSASDPLPKEGGRHKVRVSGIGNYSNSATQIDTSSFNIGKPTFRTMVLDISPRDINDDVMIVDYETAYEYTGNIVEPTVTMSMVIDGSVFKLVKDTDFTLEYSQISSGDGEATITGKGNYQGTISFSYTIQAPSEEASVLVYTPSETVKTPSLFNKLNNTSTSSITDNSSSVDYYDSFNVISFDKINSVFDICRDKALQINIGGDGVRTQATNNMNLFGKNIKLPTLEAIGSGNFVLAIDDKGNIVKRSSAKKYKENINYNLDYDYWHKVFMKLKSVSYNYKNTQNTFELGMIADDVAKICPDIVRYSNKEKTDVENYDDRAIIQMLVMEVQRLNKEIDRLNLLVR